MIHGCIDGTYTQPFGTGTYGTSINSYELFYTGVVWNGDCRRGPIDNYDNVNPNHNTYDYDATCSTTTLNADGTINAPYACNTVDWGNTYKECYCRYDDNACKFK